MPVAFLPSDRGQSEAIEQRRSGPTLGTALFGACPMSRHNGNRTRAVLGSVDAIACRKQYRMRFAPKSKIVIDSAALELDSLVDLPAVPASARISGRCQLMATILMTL